MKTTYTAAEFLMRRGIRDLRFLMIALPSLQTMDEWQLHYDSWKASDQVMAELAMA